MHPQWDCVNQWSSFNLVRDEVGAAKSIIRHTTESANRNWGRTHFAAAAHRIMGPTRNHAPHRASDERMEPEAEAMVS